MRCILLIPSLALTRVRFGGADVWPEPEDWGSLVQVAEASGVQAYPSPGADAEIARWQKHPAVKQVWQFTNKVYDYSTREQAAAVASMMTKVVPGLAVTFQDVFDAFDAAGCPVWLIGGTVRDLLAGLKPNDVDTAVLCDAREVKRVCTRMRWKHDPEDQDPQPYFSVGIAHGDDEEYLEGFSMDLIMSDPFTPETSVNLLFWSMKHGFVLDPSGFGVADAVAKVLRPAAPPKERVQHGSTWSTWRQWVLGSFSGPTHMRHNRYLKMRMRGWTAMTDTLTQPSGLCFSFFMGNQLATLLPLESMSPELVIDPRTQMTRTGDPQPLVPGATLFFLQEKPAARAKSGDLKMSDEAAQAYVAKFLDVVLAELDLYYRLPSAEYVRCTEGGLVARAQRGAAQSADDLVRQTLIALCEKPPMHMIMAAHPEVFAPPAPEGQEQPDIDFPRGCKLLLEAWKAKTGEAVTASDFKLPSMSPHAHRLTGAPGRAPISQFMGMVPTLMPYLQPYWGASRIEPAVAPAFMPQVIQLAPAPVDIRPPVFQDFSALGGHGFGRTGPHGAPAFHLPGPGARASFGFGGMVRQEVLPLGAGRFSMEPQPMPQPMVRDAFGGMGGLPPLQPAPVVPLGHGHMHPPVANMHLGMHPVGGLPNGGLPVHPGGVVRRF